MYPTFICTGSGSNPKWWGYRAVVADDCHTPIAMSINLYTDHRAALDESVILMEECKGEKSKLIALWEVVWFNPGVDAQSLVAYAIAHATKFGICVHADKPLTSTLPCAREHALLTAYKNRHLEEAMAALSFESLPIL